MAPSSRLRRARAAWGRCRAGGRIWNRPHRMCRSGETPRSHTARSMPPARNRRDSVTDDAGSSAAAAMHRNDSAPVRHRGAAQGSRVGL